MQVLELIKLHQIYCTAINVCR